METVLLALGAVEAAVNLFNKLRATARQNAELTPEQEAELDARIKAATAAEHWRPESPAPTEGH
jgi:hypothetical protein